MHQSETIEESTAVQKKMIFIHYRGKVTEGNV